MNARSASGSGSESRGRGGGRGFDDGLSAGERARLTRPIDSGVLARAREIAGQYKLVISPEPGVGYFGHTLEMPGAMADGRSIDACARAVLEATTAAIAVMIEGGERPPAPSADLKRDQQVNLRLTAEEKLRLEAAAGRNGFRSLSEYIRAAALGRAG
jgi:predicted RNase H-like HicB family nuclease